ncbi:hypothetical protein KSF78_0001039 [Schistosoma japonicum]|nr:hypothetical protein KSF78_0001039 [Schistosoma japonicum]
MINNHFYLNVIHFYLIYLNVSKCLFLLLLSYLTRTSHSYLFAVQSVFCRSNAFMLQSFRLNKTISCLFI